MKPDLAELDWSPDEMRAMAHAVVERVVEHLATLDEQPASGAGDAAELCRELREPPPERGVPLDELLGPLFERWIGRSFNAAAPSYLAYVPGGGVFPAALADFIANGVNRYTGVWNAAPALVQLEANVLDWFRQWMHMPPSTRGLLTTGGSLATFSAIVAAREKLLGTELRQGVLYTSTQAHHCIAKAARLAGILPDRVRAIDVDEQQRLQVDQLDEAITQDEAAGLRPFLVASSAGTTNTGAVDPIEAIADLCARRGLWHHVDAAYGGFFHLCPELQPLLKGLPRADSLVLDPHKGLFLPYGTGALLVRDGEALRQAHAATAGYLPPVEEEFYCPSQYGPELSRDFRGLRVWLPLKLYGLERYQAALREKRALALRAAEVLAELPEIELVAPPQLSLLAFQLRWPGATMSERNAATRELLDRVLARQNVLLTGATVGERFLARICVLCHRTRAPRIELCLRDVAEEARAIVSAKGAMRPRA